MMVLRKRAADIATPICVHMYGKVCVRPCVHYVTTSLPIAYKIT